MTQRLTAALTLALACSGSVLAQPEPRTSREGDALNPVRRFEATAPKLGELVPDLSLHDSNGRELRLRQLVTGHHAVLVLGCLT